MAEQANLLPDSAADALAVARDIRAQQLALKEIGRRALVRAVHLLTDAGLTRRAAADALGITCGAVQHALAEQCPPADPDPLEPTQSQNWNPTRENGVEVPATPAQEQLRRRPMALGECDASRAEALRLHHRTLLALATDARCCLRGLPDEHASRRSMLARARAEKAALILDPERLEVLAKVASKLLKEQANEQERDEDVRVLVDLSAFGVPRHDWPTYGDIAVANRESAANEALEQLRDSVLIYAEDDADHVARANDGHSKPIGYHSGFGPDEFAALAPKLAALLNQPYLARTDRVRGQLLVAIAELDDEKRQKLRTVFIRWRKDNRAEEVTRDDLAKLLRGMLRALGATKDAAKHLFEADDAREMRRAERAAGAAPSAQLAG